MAIGIGWKNFWLLIVFYKKEIIDFDRAINFKFFLQYLG